MGAVRELLIRRGLVASEEEIARMIEVVLVEGGSRRRHPEPRRLLGRPFADLLVRGGFDLDHLEVGPGDPAATAALEYSALLATALTTRAAAERLGVSESSVRHRLRRRELYGLKVEKKWRLPGFQFTPDGLVPGIARVVRQLPLTLHPVAVHRWLHTRNPDLEGGPGGASTPLEWLRTGGDAGAVADLAAWVR
jgi:hypothetical protein